ncbi:MAG: PQQ-binding-like beta-propeller repeat protein, partial [Gammaproteobacteria bacterium]
MFRTRNVVSGAVMCVLVLVGCAPEEESAAPGPSGRPAPTATDAEWTLYGNDPGEQRFSPLTQIDKSNVMDLGLAWSFELGSTRGVETTPIVVDGVMYVTAPWSIVFALDAKSGALIWRYDPRVPRQWGRYACCDVVNRGVAVANGTVFVGTIDGRLVAINATDGTRKWMVQTTPTDKPYTITGAPRVIKDKVLIGNGGAELGVRGFITAYDVATGEQAWRFYTVPGNPADPVEHPALEAAMSTWNGNWWEIGGGGTAWDSMAYDPELNLLYIGVGNGSPWTRYARSPGGGDNLYLCAIIAIDPDTGRMAWYYQTTPGDNWDYTAVQHIMLADLTIEGVSRKVLLQAPKNGFFYVLDRT